jgi:hypothetical protein
MSSSYFSNFPRKLYFDVVAVNITLRAGFIKKLKEKSVAFYPFVIRQEERPEHLAYDYYDSPEFDWLIFLANDIVDPYTQWPKGQLEFDEYIKKKYSSIENAKSTILFYRKNPDIFYIKKDGSDFTSSVTNSSDYNLVITNDDIRITPESYNLIDDQINYFPVYAYDYEIQDNESKRNIVLIDDSMKNLVVQELEKLLNG